MRPFLALLALLIEASTLPAQSAPPPFPLKVAEINSPAGRSAYAPVLSTGPDGDTYLAWIEPGKPGARLLVSRYDRTAQHWSEAHLITTSPELASATVDTPGLTAGQSQTLAVVWLENTSNGGTRGWTSRSDNGGLAWTPPSALTAESEQIEFPTIALLADGNLLAAWLDRRAHGNGQPTRLYARVLGQSRPDQLIDDSVCDCCQLSLTAFPNGAALIAYRARREGEIRDIYTSVWQDGHWTEPHVLNADEWRSKGCPVNGPQLDSNGGNVSVAWFTGADNSPRVYASASPDAGLRFLQPQRVDLGEPLGRADTVQLRDGSRLVTWVEGGDANHAGIYLRRISDRDEIGPAVRLADQPASRPRIALVKDYDATPAQILLAYTRDTDLSGIETLLVTLPDLSSLVGRKPCLPCDEQDANATRGYPVKGRIVAVLTDDQVSLSFEEIPGVMRATTLTCKVDPELWLNLPEHKELLGRIEQRERVWWLFNVKLLGEHLGASPAHNP